MPEPKIYIIGAGLTGLTIAYLLQKKGIHAQLLEANSRIGGRIETISGESGVTIEMGATWFSQQHPSLLALLDELELPYFKQHTSGISLFETMSFVPPQKFEIPETEAVSYRLEGGSMKLINTLVAKIGLENLKKDSKVIALKLVNNQIEITTEKGEIFIADKVISTLPPHLLVQTITFDPKLPESLLQLAKKTHTWMGESIKFAVEYPTAFWKENNFSGTIFSQASIIQEMYDHSSSDHTKFALKGFLNGGTNTLSKDERKEKVIRQLIRFFGAEANNYTAYYEKVWRDEPLTFLPYEKLVMAHQNNGHAMYKNIFFEDKLYLSGSETATQNPGYMDGAINAAQSIASQF
ncbi:flavin monoamine oxidase family protein [Flavobacterium taihuense]|uniref:FAD-dependent oxidoreductase n=1 Tax=Flavobacterium taihuense TaxID=2857508 RepID=A0ABS6XR33_9FLAO|nr:FAD-dependent oxidoreductase [Flavobacterium taihuense]MBW4359130.1 FAD-dependent oxidoreductase [Flavobacterium taihuense]